MTDEQMDGLQAVTSREAFRHLRRVAIEAARRHGTYPDMDVKARVYVLVIMTLALDYDHAEGAILLPKAIISTAALGPEVGPVTWASRRLTEFAKVYSDLLYAEALGIAFGAGRLKGWRLKA